jgi:ATP-dependent Lhr-like helicase
VRATPIALVDRAELGGWRTAGDDAAPASAEAEAVLELLRRAGASFFADIVRGTGLVRAQAEEALGELVSLGLVTSDAFSGLRALLVPANRRRTVHPRRSRRAVFGMETAGRWSLLGATPTDEERRIETVARALLRRWGVVFRRLLDREGSLPPWRELLRVYRRLEARGELRGGRFVGGFTGEQYALPEAVGLLRKARREGGQDALVSVSAADPLNILGVLTPGRRLPAIASNRVLFRDGVPIAVREGGEIRFLEPPEERSRFALEGALVRKSLPRQVRAYLG